MKMQAEMIAKFNPSYIGTTLRDVGETKDKEILPIEVDIFEDAASGLRLEVSMVDADGYVHAGALAFFDAAGKLFELDDAAEAQLWEKIEDEGSELSHMEGRACLQDLPLGAMRNLLVVEVEPEPAF